MIEHRPFPSLDAIRRDGVDVRQHFRAGDVGRADHAPLGPLHMWNDIEFAQHVGLGLRAHRDVEIVTWVRSGGHHSRRRCGQSRAPGCQFRPRDECRHGDPSRRAQRGKHTRAAVPDLAPSAHTCQYAALRDARLFARMSRGPIRYAGERRSGGCPRRRIAHSRRRTFAYRDAARRHGNAARFADARFCLPGCGSWATGRRADQAGATRWHCRSR